MNNSTLCPRNRGNHILLTHHWLDALSFWSLEDLYLSATTLLQIIAATEEEKSGRKFSFEQGVASAAARVGIRSLGPGFKDMRNELIHAGRLIGTRFTGPDKGACVAVVADVLNWFDEYMHAALRLGTPRFQRFGGGALMGMNSFSIS